MSYKLFLCSLLLNQYLSLFWGNVFNLKKKKKRRRRCKKKCETDTEEEEWFDNFWEIRRELGFPMTLQEAEECYELFKDW